MKVGTTIFLVLAGFGTVGYPCSGWLLLQSLITEKGLLASFTFTNLFILWLLPLLVGLILLALRLVRRKKQ